MMHLMLHIFKKDARRLRWAIALALLLQVAVAYVDATRNSAYPGMQEGWVTILLLVTWASLIALAVHEDSLVGDRQFWISRPYRWPMLLGAKLLFATAFVHAPSFLADAVILGARGFHPWEWIPHLLAKQLMLAAALTLPVMAMAAVLQNFAQLALTVVLIGAVIGNRVAFVADVFMSSWLAGLRVILLDGFLVAPFVLSVAIILLQFARRQTWRSRILGIVSVVVVVLLFSFVSPIFISRAQAALDPGDSRISIELGAMPAPGDLPDTFEPHPYREDNRWAELKLPLHIAGIPAGVRTYFMTTEFELTAPDGRRYKDQIEPHGLGGHWLLLRVRRALFDKIKNTNVELKVTAVALLFRRGETTTLPLESNRPVPLVGRCYSEVVEDKDRLGDGFGALRAVCESPAGFPLPPDIFLRQSGGTAIGPILTEYAPSLSPISRVQNSFSLRQEQFDSAAASKLSITPNIARGWEVVKVELRNLHLSDYVY